MSQPLVSILVPVYKVELYIERCVRSVFEQTYDNLEFIFCDDCSTDASIRILETVMKDYPQREKQVQIICNDSNRGLAAVRSILVANATGDFVFHIDSDDWVEKNAVELLVSKQMESAADIVTARAYAHEHNKVEPYLDGGWNLDKQSMMEMMLKGKCSVSLWRRLIRKSLYTGNNLQPDEKGSCCEDFQVMLPLVWYSKSVVGIDAFIYHYDVTNTNSITNSYKDNLEIQLQILISRQVVSVFFSDKNLFYKNLCDEFAIRQAHFFMIRHWRNNRKEAYSFFVKYIKEFDKQYWSCIKWDFYLIRMLESNYHLLFVIYFIRRCYSLFSNHFYLKNEESACHRR